MGLLQFKYSTSIACWRRVVRRWGRVHVVLHRQSNRDKDDAEPACGVLRCVPFLRRDNAAGRAGSDRRRAQTPGENASHVRAPVHPLGYIPLLHLHPCWHHVAYPVPRLHHAPRDLRNRLCRAPKQRHRRRPLVLGSQRRRPAANIGTLSMGS